MPMTSSPRLLYAVYVSRRTGVSAWHGGHHDAQKLIQTTLPRRSASRTGRPARSVSVNVEPFERVTVKSGARSPGRRPTAGGDPMMNGVARGSRGPNWPVLPSGAVTARSTTIAATTTTSPPAIWRAPNGPMSPWRAGRCWKAGRSEAMSDGGIEREVARQEAEPAGDHRDPDRDHERPAHDRDGTAVPDQRSEERRRPVVEEAHGEERDAQAERVAAEEQGPLERAPPGGGKRQHPAEDDPDAGRPADREDRPEPE